MTPARRHRGEGGVYQRADGRWVAQIDLGYIGGKRKRKYVYADTQRGAVKKLREARKAIDEGDLNTAGITVETWLNYWLDDICPTKPRMKPKTLRNYRSYVEGYLIPFLGKKRLDRLAPPDLRALANWILEPRPDGSRRSSTTAHHAHVILGTALNDAVRDRRITTNIASLVPAPPLEAAPQNALSLAEFGALMRLLDGDRLQSRWAFALFTGARQGECLGLRWDHVDLVNGVADLEWQLQRIPYRHGCGPRDGKVWPCGKARADRCPARELDVRRGFEHRTLDGNLCLQRPKTKGSTRVIPLPEPLLVAMRERRTLYDTERRAYTKDHGLVWCREDGRPIDGRKDWAEWSELLARLDIRHMELHAARHTASTLLLALGVPEDVRMAILGHSEAATTRRYSHVDLTMQRQAMETYGAAVAELLGGPSRALPR